MNKKQLEENLNGINTRLTALGDLSTLLQQSQNLPTLIADAEKKKSELDVFLNDLPTKKGELDTLVTNTQEQQEKVNEKDEEVAALILKTQELQKKVEELIELTTSQLGIAANAKLSSTFEGVKDELNKEKDKFFWWLVGVVAALIAGTAIIVWWQVSVEGTLYHLSFPVRIALLSPVVYFVIFINREYNRAKSLIEEYMFKAAIARSFEAYKAIVEAADSEGSTKTLDFILSSITGIYSSPMVNIKANKMKESENTPDLLSKVKSMVPGADKLPE